MLELVLASNNQHKIRELSILLDPQLFKIVPPPEKLEVEENGASYYENAHLKAKACFELCKCPVVADDSGLNVLAYPDELGIKSARFGGPGLKDEERTQLLLERVKKLPLEQRGAHYTCVLCFYLSPQEIYFFEGKLEGELIEEWKGAGGFGYDPIFHPTGRPEGVTLAMEEEWKEKNSHRSRAAQRAVSFFKGRICQKG